MSAESELKRGGELLAAVSNVLVGLQKEHAGKGPTKAKTYWAGDDILIVVMGGGYTDAEQTLFQGGQGRSVRTSRHAFEDVMEERLRDAIQGLTGREVVAFMSASHQSPDLLAEVFVLAPTETDSPMTA